MSQFRNREVKLAIMKERGTFKSLLLCGSNKLLVAKAHQSGSSWGISTGFLALCKGLEGVLKGKTR